ncbi:glucosyltransferase domain-containing protein [Lactovum odontotermitis]
MTQCRDKFRTMFLGNILAFLAVFSIFLKMHYSIDSYDVYFSKSSLIQLNNSRYVNYLIDKILHFVGVNTVSSQGIFTLFFIISIAWCAARLSNFSLQLLKTIGKVDIKTDVIVNVIVAISFVNVFMTEWFLFPEIMLYYAIAIVCSVESCIALYEKRYIISFVLLLLSLFSYQAAMPIFTVYYLFFVFLSHRFVLSKNSVKDVLNGLVLTLSTVSAFLIVQKFVNQGGEQNS